MRYICTKCNIEKDEQDFNKDNKNKRGRRSECKICQKDRRSKYTKLKLRKELIIKFAKKYMKTNAQPNFQAIEDIEPEEKQEESITEEITNLIS